MKTFVFSSMMSVEAENEDEATLIFKEQSADFVREATIDIDELPSYKDKEVI